MVILTRVNVGGVNSFAAVPLYGFTLLFHFQVFMRRILQVSAELRDARDLFHAVVRPPRLSARQAGHFHLTIFHTGFDNNLGLKLVILIYFHWCHGTWPFAFGI